MQTIHTTHTIKDARKIIRDAGDLIHEINSMPTHDEKVYLAFDNELTPPEDKTPDDSTWLSFDDDLTPTDDEMDTLGENTWEVFQGMPETWDAPVG